MEQRRSLGQRHLVDVFALGGGVTEGDLGVREIVRVAIALELGPLIGFERFLLGKLGSQVGRELGLGRRSFRIGSDSIYGWENRTATASASWPDR